MMHGADHASQGDGPGSIAPAPPFAPPDPSVLTKCIRWIERFDTQHARDWGRLYTAAPEAATCEAMFWAVLVDCGVTVAPNADLTGKERAPDFVCRKDGEKFYVEVTCIHQHTAAAATGLPLNYEPGGQTYRNLNHAIFAEVRNKTPQCANLDAPCFNPGLLGGIAFGHLHY